MCITVLLLFRINAFAEEENFVAKYGWLRVSGTSIVSENGEKLQLRGVSSHGITWYPQYTGYDATRSTKDWGANVFRVAMYVAQDKGFIYFQEENEERMYRIIEDASSPGMYVIADWHVLRDKNPLLYKEEAKAFFERLSSEYAGNPAVIYEICNEPNGDTSWEDIRAYANEIIPIIRNHSPKALILVGTQKFSSRFEGPMESPLAFENIMYVMHKYFELNSSG